MPSNRLADNFRENVRRCRVLRGWSQVELSQRIGVASSYVSTLENGARFDFRLSTVERFADALSVSPLMLIAEPTEEKSKKIG